MDEVSSSGPLDCPRSRASPIKDCFHLVFESHTGRAAVPIPKRSARPRVISTPQWRIGLKALDQNRPIREGTRGDGKGPVPAPCMGTDQDLEHSWNFAVALTLRMSGQGQNRRFSAA